MAENFNPTEWITTAEAAELTGYSSVTFRWLVRRCRAMPHRVSQEKKYPLPAGQK